jgi:hypothetical protein
MSDKHHVFLSYSRKDSEIMRRIYDDLRSEGLNVWMDDELKAGTPEWERDIENAIKNTGTVVVVLSPDSKASDWVQREITFAESFEKRIFPVLVRGDAKTAVPIRLVNHNRVNVIKDYHGAIQKLATDICHHLGIESKTQRRQREAQANLKVEVPPRTNEAQIREQQQREQRLAVEDEKKPAADNLGVSASLMAQRALRRRPLTTRRVNSSDEVAASKTGTAAPSYGIDYDDDNKFHYRPGSLRRVYPVPLGERGWYLATLTWLPLFISLGALSFNVIPTTVMPLGLSFLQWTIASVILWLAFIFLWSKDLFGLIALLVLIPTVFAGFVSWGIANVTPWGGIISVVASVLAVFVVVTRTFDQILVMGLVFGLIVGAGIALISGIMGVIVGVVVGGVVLALISSLTEADFEFRSFLGGILYLSVFISCVALIWIYWLGGWRVLAGA